MKAEEKKDVEIASIPFEQLVIMVNEYANHTKDDLDRATNKQVKSVWFPISQITRISEQLVREKADGLRIYLGRYPKDVSKFKDPKPIPETNTVIFVSTYAVDGYHQDYYTTLNPIIPENRGEQCQPKCDGTLNPKLLII